MDVYNKVIKTPNPQLLSYYFPKLYVTNTFLPIQDVLYTGPAQNIIQFKRAGYRYIATNGFPEIDLTDRKIHLKFIYSKYNREPPKYLLDICNLYEEDTFIRYCKEYWLTHTWPEKLEDETINVFTLYQDLNRGSSQLTKTLFTLLQTKDPKYIEASVLTFLERVKFIEDQTVGAGYKKVLEKFRENNLDNLRPAITKHIKSKIENKELSIYLLLQDLTKR